MKKTAIIIVMFSIIFYPIGAQEILTLEKAIALTLENNYDIKISKNNEKISENNKGILNSGFLPTLSTSTSGKYAITETSNKLNSGEVLEINENNTVNYTANMQLNYLLFDGFGRINNLKKLKEEHQLSQMQTEFVIENTIFQVARQYYQVAQQVQTIKILKQSLKISSKRLTKEIYNFEFGQNTKLEILNAEVDYNNDSINLMNSILLLSNNKRILNELMGVAIDNDFETENKVNFSSELTLELLIEDALENNKSLNLLEKNILLNKFNLKIIKSNWLPKISLNGTYAFNNTNFDASNSNVNFVLPINYSNNYGPSAFVNISWNLFDGGRTITNTQNTKIRIANQETSLEYEKLKLEKNVKTSWYSYQNALEVLNIQTINLETNQTNFKRTEEKFKAGQINSIFFRQAQLNLLNAKNQLNIAKFNAKIMELNLLLLSGGLAK